MLNLYNTPKKSIFIFLVASIIFFISAIKTEIGESHNSKYSVYTIEFNYFGMDAGKLEEIITKPLEELIISMTGILEFKSTVEYSKSITNVYFSRKSDSKKNYLAIRNLVESLYETLPGDVQKPRIYTSDFSSKGIYCLVFTGNEDNSNLREWVEFNLKKKIESIKGVSEVIVTGGAQKEILVSFDSDKAAGAMQNPEVFASIIQNGNFDNYQTTLDLKNHKDYIKFNTKIMSLNEMQELPVNLENGMTNLGYIADIDFSFKEEDEIVTLNGKRCVSLVVKSSSAGNSITICSECRKILKNINFGSFEYTVLYDVGKEQWKMIKNIIIALFQSFICILLIIPLFFNTKRSLFLLIILLPTAMLWTIGILQIFGISVNQNILAGITISLGLVVDPLLVIAETSEQALSRLDFINKIRKLFVPLISATVTTLAAFIPLFFLDNIVPGVKNIAFAITLMIVVSLVIELVFIPCFIYKSEKTQFQLNKKSEKTMNKSIYKIVFFSIKKYKILSILYILLMISSIYIFIISGKSLSFSNENNIISCSIDYSPELSKEFISSEILPFIQKIKANTNVIFVKSEVQKGSVDIEVGYKEKIKRREIAKYINSLNIYIQNGFLYVPGIENKIKTKHASIEIAFSGDDSKTCKNIARQAANILAQKLMYSSIVLNFKNDEEECVFYPDLIKLKNNDLDVYTLASTLRWFLFGPVADKWIDNGKEYDIRITGKDLSKTSIDKIKKIKIPVKTGAVPLDSLGEIKKTSSNGRIYHKNSRRCAYITVEVDKMSTDKAIALLKKDLSNIKMDKGYAYSFNYEFSKMKENYKILIYSLIFSILQIFLVLMFLMENLKKTIMILTAISVSMFLPLFIRFILRSPIELGDIVGIIILSGLTVNNIVYILESNYNSIIYKIRNKSKSIIVSTLTTIISAIPLMIMTTDRFSRQISYHMIAGMIGSAGGIILIIPSTGNERKPETKRREEEK